MIRKYSGTFLVAGKGANISQDLTKCLKTHPANAFFGSFSPLPRAFLASVSRWSIALEPLDHAEQERRKPLLRLHLRTWLGMIWYSA
jgi:hypothetical protein